jgi:competence ComEA-like helix-hairpin-helix protein
MGNTRVRTPAACLFAAALMFVAAIAVRASTSSDQAQGAKAGGDVAALMAKGPGDLTQEEQDALDAAAESTMQRVCIACHPFENIIRTRRTLREWSDQVTNMAQRGAPGTEKDFALVKRYLTRWYGIVRVNTATPEELSSVLGLPAKVATAVVDYRKEHGNFTDVAGLLKVDGVDKAKLEEQPEALRFD